MENYQSRVIEEKQELDQKAEKLESFIASKEFSSVPPLEKERMKRQLGIMRDYCGVLGERIEHFTQNLAS